LGPTSAQAGRGGGQPRSRLKWEEQSVGIKEFPPAASKGSYPITTVSGEPSIEILDQVLDRATHRSRSARHKCRSAFNCNGDRPSSRSSVLLGASADLGQVGQRDVRLGYFLGSGHDPACRLRRPAAGTVRDAPLCAPVRRLAADILVRRSAPRRSGPSDAPSRVGVPHSTRFVVASSVTRWSPSDHHPGGSSVPTRGAFDEYRSCVGMG